MDDYIGSPLPSAQTSSNYNDLKDLKDIYFKKVKRRYNYWDYVKLIQYIDHTLFKIIEQHVPAKANIKTGLLIEPHYLERNKFGRTLPTTTLGSTMVEGSYQTIEVRYDPDEIVGITGSDVYHSNVSQKTGSDGKRIELAPNFNIDVSGYILDEEQHGAQAPIAPFSSITGKPGNYKAYDSSTLLGNATKGRLSGIYFRSLQKGKEQDY